jgi:hypothetical protein
LDRLTGKSGGNGGCGDGVDSDGYDGDDGSGGDNVVVMVKMVMGWVMVKVVVTTLMIWW